MNFKSESEQQLEDIREIRNLMERSSRFISLSGLSGIFAGIFALLGAGAAWWYLWKVFPELPGDSYRELYTFLFADAIIVLALSLSAGVLFTTRNAKRKGQPIWDITSRHLLINLAIPLIAGGFFCLILLDQRPQLIASATLLFYGLALINASKYTVTDIRTLGLCEIALGLISATIQGYSLIFWAIGFGVLHIIYGTVMYYKYER